MPLLTPDDFDSVRAALDIDLTEDDVPDAVIALPIYQTAGEAEVLWRVPDAESLTGDALAAARNAATLFVAALVAEGLPRTTQERIGEWSRSLARGSNDVAGMAAALRRRAEAALAPLLPVVTPRRRFAGGFVVAPAAR